MKIALRPIQINTHKNIKTLLSIAALSFTSLCNAQDTAAVNSSTSSSWLPGDPLLIAFAVVAFVLALVILAFAETVRAASHLRAIKEMKEREEKKEDPAIKSLAILLFISGLSGSLFAQAPTAPVVVKEPDALMGMNPYLFYLLVSIIAVELIVIFWLYLFSRHLLGINAIRQQKAAEAARSGIRQPSLIDKLNASVALDKEADIMTDHEYDGIRELDNDLPPWWKYGFYLTIVVAIVYMVHYHISGTGKLQLEEYEVQLARGRQEAAEFRKRSANLVDENNVTVLTDQAALAGGKLVFETHCSACHGKAGEGTVGPNLTDDYWLHKGGIRDVFRSVKYGWPEKGMKSWQQDLGARQIHEVSSYIMSLHGTNPANAKEKQGELYMDETMPDTAEVAGTDSLKLVGKDKVDE